LACPGRPQSTAIVDLDGDGKRDIAVTGAGLNAVVIFHNAGTDERWEQQKLDLPVAGLPDSVKVCAADVDADGRPDLVASISCDSRIAVFKNISSPGKLEFAAPVLL